MGSQRLGHTLVTEQQQPDSVTQGRARDPLTPSWKKHLLVYLRQGFILKSCKTQAERSYMCVRSKNQRGKRWLQKSVSSSKNHTTKKLF